MPVFRSWGRGHGHAADDLRMGRFPVSGVNDESVLTYVKPEHTLTIGPVAPREVPLEVVDYRPYAIALGIISFFAGCYSIVFLLFFALNPEAGVFWQSMVAGVFSALLIWFSLFRKVSKFVVFDRDSRLVHIPNPWSKKVDVAYWDDLSFCIIDEPGGYAGLSPVTVFYVVRPGWDLLRDGYPPRRFRVRVMGDALERITTEQYWAALVRFMRTDRRSLGSPEGIVEWIEQEHGGDWSAYYRHIDWRLQHFDYSKLAKTPNWIREPDGRWRRVAERQSDASQPA